MRADICKPFAQTGDNGQTLNLSNSSASFTVTVPFPRSPEYSGTLRVTNLISALPAYVKQSNTAPAVATIANMIVPGNQVAFFDLKPDTVSVGVFSAGSGTVHVDFGSGGV